MVPNKETTNIIIILISKSSQTSLLLKKCQKDISTTIHKFLLGIIFRCSKIAGEHQTFLSIRIAKLSHFTYKFLNSKTQQRRVQLLNLILNCYYYGVIISLIKQRSSTDGLE
ncbi:Hypothetical_protein [Hexamita inflata]|uniref:Hypothetical_protein n=1 Tax=Hexamita inflata TaxID=28002 RepID=A0ABP1H983_9EUKA